MNRALLIIGVPTIVVAAAFAGAFWGRWAAVPMAGILAVGLASAAWLERRRRQGKCRGD